MSLKSSQEKETTIPQGNLSKIVGNQYELIEIIGRGATGVVYKGKNMNTGELVAVKALDLKKMSKHQTNNVKGEISLLKSLNHPNIVKILDNFTTENEMFLILEFMENGSLGSTLKTEGKFPEELVAKYMYQIIRGLNFLHSKGIIHRDIKGDNILISKSGRLCLADFGVAVKMDASQLEIADNEDVVGTPYWLAPEVILMTAQTTASDIWSIGCTIIELLTGSPPYGSFSPMGAIFHMVRDEYPPLPKGISEEGKEFLLQCFIKDITARATANKLLQHPWLCLYEEKLDVKSMRQSLRVYNRKPTVSAPQPPDLQTIISGQMRGIEKEKMEVERMDKIAAEVRASLTNTTIDDEHKLKGVELIDRYKGRLHIINKRIQKWQVTEAALNKLGVLYGKCMKEEKENYEKQLQSLRDQLYADQKAKETLEPHIRQLQESFYDSAKAIRDSNSIDEEYLQFKKDDLIFIITQTEDNSKYIGEHSKTSQQGFVKFEDVHILEKHSKDENVVSSIEAKERKTKLANLLGATVVDIDDSFRLSQSKSSSPNLSKAGNRENSLSVFMRKRGIIKQMFAKTSSENIRNSTEKTEISNDKQMLFNLLSNHPHILSEDRKFIMGASFRVQESIDKPKEKYVFLFSDLLLLTKNHKIETKISLENARVILPADNIAKDGIQIQSNNVMYTMTPIESESDPSAIRDNWFRELKRIVNENVRKKFFSNERRETEEI